MTGKAWGRARTIFGRHKIILLLNSRGRPKKVFTQIGRQGPGPVACFRDTIFARGTVLSWGGGSRRDSTVRISIHAHRFKDEDQKKVFVTKSESSSWCSRVLSSYNKSVLMLGGGNKQYFWGSAGPKKHFSGTGIVTLVWGTIFAWGEHFRL